MTVIRDDTVYYDKHGYGMRVKVQGHALHIIVDLTTGDFIVGELPSEDEVTRMIARGVIALATLNCPESTHVAAMDSDSPRTNDLPFTVAPPESFT